MGTGEVLGPQFDDEVSRKTALMGSLILFLRIKFAGTKHKAKYNAVLDRYRELFFPAG